MPLFKMIKPTPTAGYKAPTCTSSQDGALETIMGRWIQRTSTVVFCHFRSQCDTLRPYPILRVKGQHLMQLPIVAPAPVVTAHADVFRDLFENRCQFQHFQNYLTGLIVLDNKSLANITRCVLES